MVQKADSRIDRLEAKLSALEEELEARAKVDAMMEEELHAELQAKIQESLQAMARREACVVAHIERTLDLAERRLERKMQDFAKRMQRSSARLLALTGPQIERLEARLSALEDFRLEDLNERRTEG